MQNNSNTFRNNIIVALILILTLTLGAYFRFNGLNWDDFTYLHPDERFLTVQLLPAVGGNNEFTPDDEHFPAQSILVKIGENRFASLFELGSTDQYRIGTIDDTRGYDIARSIVDDAFIREYESTGKVVQALQIGDVDAIVVPQAEALDYASITFQLESFSTQDVQSAYCQVKYPSSNGRGSYFDTQCSPLNPHNANVGFYTYGTLPLFMAHFASDFVQALVETGGTILEFNGGHLVWRSLSALFDTLTILLIFLLATKMHNKWVGLLAAILYTASALAIQKAHFGTVNSITHFFVVLALLFAIMVQDRPRWLYYILFGIATSAAVAGRINTAPLAGIIVIPAMIQMLPAFDTDLEWSQRRKIFLHNLFGLILAGIASFIAFRIFNPYAFEGPGFFNILPNARWLDNIASGQFGVSGQQDSPPNWQWLARPAYLFPLKDMILWGMGIAFGILAWFSVGWASYRVLRGKLHAIRNLAVLVWVLGYFLWIGRLWVMTMRYYLPLYGALAVLAGWAIWQLYQTANKKQLENYIPRFLLLVFSILLGIVGFWGDAGTTSMVASILGIGLGIVALLPGFERPRIFVLGGFVVGFTLLWAFMHSNIYNHQLTRVQASRWLWENIPGDFAMQIDGASADVPIINIGIPNNGYYEGNLEAPGTLLERANVYFEGSPVFISFTVPVDGTISSVYAPHLGDPNDDDEIERLYISIAESRLGEPLSTATLESDFVRDTHILGRPYNILLDNPIQVEAGKEYTFKVEALADSGLIIGSGSVVLTEGDWDDRITSTQICTLPEGLTLADDIEPGLRDYGECNGQQPWYALVNSYDMAMSYPVDDLVKQENIVDSLAVGDFIAISSNRFYDTLSRNVARWPLSTEYYDKLFKGELGYELVATFDETYELGPLRVSDQYLPSYNAPSWLNELEADEAFHVYDHPAVFIFQKQADYSHERTAHLLESVPIARAEQIFDQMTVPGVVYWSSLEADEAPTILQIPPSARETQLEGGTWSDRFDSDSILNTQQVVGVIVWWITIIIFGLITFPLLFAVFPFLADRGYGFAKIIGLLLTSWFAWVLSSLQVPLWSRTGILLSMLVLASLSAFVVWKRKIEFMTFLRERWSRLVFIEIITLVAFLVLIFVRLTNPDLWHFAKGGEKPMDFAYFNAVLRSTVFPPIDPWYAGGYINYYYFGFVLVGAPVLLLGIIPSIAYNLIVPTIFATTAIGAFSVAFNIVSAFGEKSPEIQTTRRLGNPWIAGIAALLLAVVFGNLDTVRVIGNEVAKVGGYEIPLGIENYLTEKYTEEYMLENGIATPPPDIMTEIASRARNHGFFDRIEYEFKNSTTLVSGLFTGISRVISGTPLNIRSDRWYWGPSRVIAEIPDAHENAITEMPYFTFLYADLHAHMINMPLLLFVMGFLLHELLASKNESRNRKEQILAIFIGALSVGIMRAVNTWDWPSFLLLSLVSLTYIWWVHWKTLDRQSLLHFVFYVGGFLTLSFLLILPYSHWYGSVYNSIRMWDGFKTPFWAYFDIHGLFLFLLVSLLIWETTRWLRTIHVRQLRGKAPFAIIGMVIIGTILIGALVAAAIEYQVALITVPLIIWIALLFFRSSQSLPMRFVLVLAGFALALTLGVEVIVIGGDIGRQNTVFKFYIQAWLLFSVVGGVTFAWLFQSSENWSNRVRGLWYAPLLILVTIAAMFPFFATRGRSYDRFNADVPLTLDGLEYMKYAEHYEANRITLQGDTLQLSEDYEMIRWLQENVDGSPIIIEGRSAASEYDYNGRISINTGLPSVLGWSFHQRQQRTFDPLPRLVDQRARNITAFYDTTDIVLAVELLYQYDVEYVIFGGLERVQADKAGFEKFERMEELGLIESVFQTSSGEGIIYRVHRDALDRYLMQQG